MLSKWGLRIIAGLLVLGALAMAGAAAYEWHWATDPTGSLAAVGVAATFLVALAAVLAIDQNRALVKASTDEARASSETVVEMQRQRESAFKPAVIIETTIRGNVEHFVVRNIGTGPAFNLRLSGHWFGGNPGDHRWMWWSAMGLAAGEEAVFPALWATKTRQQDADKYRCVVERWVASNPEQAKAAVRYDDWFGTHYRASSLSEAPDEWRNSTTLVDTPDWLRCN